MQIHHLQILAVMDAEFGKHACGLDPFGGETQYRALGAPFSLTQKHELQN
jgi:hypothetical protein